MRKKDKGKGKYLQMVFLKLSNNWWNVKKTANSSTVRFILEPTNNRKSEKERILAWSKKQFREHKAGGMATAGRVPMIKEKCFKYSKVTTFFRYFPWRVFFKTKVFFLKTLLQFHPFLFLIDYQKINKIGKQIYFSNWLI